MGFLLSLDPQFSDINEMALKKKSFFYMFCMYYVCVCAVLTEATRGHWIPGIGDRDCGEHHMGAGNQTGVLGEESVFSFAKPAI